MRESPPADRLAYADLRVLFVPTGATGGPEEGAPDLLSVARERYDLIVVGSGAGDPEASRLCATLHQARVLFDDLAPARVRTADYLGLGFSDRVDRASLARQLFAGAYARLRTLSLIRTSGSPGARLAVLRRLGSARFRRLAAAAAAGIHRSRAALLVVAAQTPPSVRLCVLAAAVRARIPVVFLGPDEPRAATARRLVHTVEPAARRVRQRRFQRGITSVSDLYGARSVVSEYCGIAERDVRIPGFWIHGWIPAYHNVHPEVVAQHKRTRYGIVAWRRDPFDRTAVQLVARTDQEALLRSHGYTRVMAIGQPFVYLARPSVRRIPGSLLVMPPLGGATRSSEDPVVRRYVERIVDIAPRFSTIRVCVRLDDYLKRNWWVAFENAGISHIVGADSLDPAAAQRMTRLLHQFEYVTSNGFGSHLPYAALAGCKVSVFGPYAAVPVDQLRLAHAVVHNPGLLERLIELCSERVLRDHYPELFVDPDRAVERQSWARGELGDNHRLSPSVLQRLMTRGWDTMGTAGSAMEETATPAAGTS